MQYDDKHISGEWFNLDFVDLADIAAMLQLMGSVDYTKHWYDKIVPIDFKEYIHHYAILTPQLVSFEKDRMIVPRYKIEENIGDEFKI